MEFTTEKERSSFLIKYPTHFIGTYMQITPQAVLLIYEVAAIKIYYLVYILRSHCSGSNSLKFFLNFFFIISPVNFVQQLLIQWAMRFLIKSSCTDATR